MPPYARKTPWFAACIELCDDEIFKIFPVEETQVAIANETKTIVGVFSSVPDAQAAVRELEAQGISRDEISIVANKHATGFDTMEDRDKASDIVADAGIGAAIGGVGGLLLSAAGALTIPVIGPILAAGPIAAALTGAGIGAAAGGLIGALTESGIPEEEAKYYAEGVRRGDVLVTVRAQGAAQADHICDTLDRHQAVDVNDRVENWRTRGWTGWSDAAQPYTPEDLRAERGYYRAGKEPLVPGHVGGIGHEGLPTPYDERPDRSTVGTTGMTGAGLKSTSERGYGSYASPDAEDITTEFKDTSETARDPRDKDADGWVIDDKMREWGQDLKQTITQAGHNLKEKGRELRSEARDTERSVEESERRRRARVYDRTLL